MVEFIPSRGSDLLETRKQGKSRLHPHLGNRICTYTCNILGICRLSGVCRIPYECVVVCSVKERLGAPGERVASLGCIVLGGRPQELWLPTVFDPRLYCGSQWWREARDSSMIPMCDLCVLSNKTGESRQFSTQTEPPPTAAAGL